MPLDIDLFQINYLPWQYKSQKTGVFFMPRNDAFEIEDEFILKNIQQYHIHTVISWQTV